MNVKHIHFLNALKKAVETDRLKLPTLPEIAIQIREAVDDEHNTAQQMADILAQDPSLTTRMLQVANSPVFRSRSQIDDLTTAITRLGTRVIRDLVICLVIKQIYKPASKALELKFKKLWSSSIEVAAISQMIACQTALKPEQALIAGLIHNIGALPVLEMAEKDEELLANKDNLNQLIQDIQGPVGKLILSFWNFPPHLIDVVEKCNMFNRQHDGPADYTDIVQIAILQSSNATNSNAADDWSKVPAFAAADIKPDTRIMEIEENRIALDEIKQSLVAM